jgi:hypothetical protein
MERITVTVRHSCAEPTAALSRQPHLCSVTVVLCVRLRHIDTETTISVWQTLTTTTHHLSCYYPQRGRERHAYARLGVGCPQVQSARSWRHQKLISGLAHYIRYGLSYLTNSKAVIDFEFPSWEGRGITFECGTQTGDSTVWLFYSNEY